VSEETKKLSAKERLAIPRQEMPQRDGIERSSDFKEVNLGLSEQAAIREAQRCLQCKNAKCVTGCPVGIDIPRFIEAVARGDFAGAAEIVRKDNDLPAITGRVCPQEIQCEACCVRCKSDTPVAVGWLERFVADYQMTHDSKAKPAQVKKLGKKVACIGSGPAGMTLRFSRHFTGREACCFTGYRNSGCQSRL
jgi:glutamate synthase (NADPH/NADH) small chain